MNSILNTESGERLSFYKLFSIKKYLVQIPIVQRDYAQGRNSSKEVRDTFLKSLHTYLEDNIPYRDLDFVYGTLNEKNGKTNFIPLDGQQRLTTLFLLHWYLYKISDNKDKKDEFRNTLTINGKSLFTYETRSSSTEFCDALMNMEVNIKSALQQEIPINKKNNTNCISNIIKNCQWFYLSWQYDPTIQSMLTMIDAIHSKFEHNSNYFERLIDNEKPIITFLFLNLKDFKLTDDLYIKMNSRGLPLTSFENFKAKFEQYLENVKTDRQFVYSFIENGNVIQKNVTLKKYFSYNIDNKWADLFWNYRKLQNRTNLFNYDNFDDELMNFIRVIFTNHYVSNFKISIKEKDIALDYLLGTSVAKKEKNYSDEFSLSKYEELNAISPESVLSLIDALDLFANGNSTIKLHLSNRYKFYYDETKNFENALKHEFESNHQRLCFHAYVRFLIFNNCNPSGIDQWLRVIHNLTHPDNTIIDNSLDIAKSMTSIESMLPYSANIIEYLKTNPDISFFSPWQIIEEKVKAHLITINIEWKNLIEKVEKHNYFNGQIGFILEFSGILDFFTLNKNCNWNSNQESEYFSKFSDYVKKASKLFEESYEKRINNQNYIFERAVLTKGNYFTSASQYRYNILSTNLVKNNIKRDHSWKRLLQIRNDSEWQIKRKYVKELFDDKRLDINDINSSLLLICHDKTNSWRDYLISSPSLINYCGQGFIRFKDEKDILLYGESQSNFYHAEMYTFYLWKNFIEKNIESFKPFSTIFYNYVKSIEEDAQIIFKDFIFNRIQYQMSIYYCNTDSLPNLYEISFSKSKGENRPEYYGEEICKILKTLNFSWNDEFTGYFYTSDLIDDVLIKIHSICNQLNKLT